MMFTNRQICFFLVGIHLLYFVAACFLKGILLVDSFGYLMQADNIQAIGNWYAEDWNAPLLIDYFSIRPPLYAWCLLLFRWFTPNLFVILIAQNILSVINCWIVYRFVLEKQNPTTRIQLLFVAGIVLYPAQMIHANFIMTEIVLQTILLFLFFCLYQFYKQPNLKYALVIALLLSVGLLTKPVTLFLPLITVVFMIWSIVKTKSSFKYMGVFGIVIITYVAIGLQHKHATGSFHYASIKSINQLKYNARYTLINAKGELYADSVINMIMGKANSYEDYGKRLQYMDDQALVIIKQDPIAFAKVYTKGVVAFFLDPGRFDLYHFFAIEEKGTIGLMHEVQAKGPLAILDYLKQAPWLLLLLLLLNLCWNVFVLFSFCRFMYLKSISHGAKMILIVLVLYIAAATGPVGVSRYRVPIYPLLLIGVLSSWPKRKQVVEEHR